MKMEMSGKIIFDLHHQPNYRVAHIAEFSEFLLSSNLIIKLLTLLNSQNFSFQIKN